MYKGQAEQNSQIKVDQWEHRIENLELLVNNTDCKYFSIQFQTICYHYENL